MAKIAVNHSVSAPGKARTGYLPTLDGWRAIAILAVIFYHDNFLSIGPFNTGWLFRHGQYGVDLFFAISGLLICSRLLEEEKMFGAISIRGFYIRRAFRILPPAFAYLIVVGILGLAGILWVSLREWFFSAIFLRNYTFLLGNPLLDRTFTNHLWSLSVEEHFYLILPAVLVLTRKRWRLQVLGGLALLIIVHRAHVLQTRLWEHVHPHTDMRLDALLIAAILAILLQSSRIREGLSKWLRLLWPLLLLAVLYLASYWDGRSWEVTLVEMTLPLLVLSSVLNPSGYLGRVLEAPPLRYIGRVSYSLYLWQQLFFVGHFLGKFPLGVLQSTPLRYLATLALSMASYHLLERPLIKLGHRLAPPATPGRNDAKDNSPKLETLSSTAANGPQV